MESLTVFRVLPMYGQHMRRGGTFGWALILVIVEYGVPGEGVRKRGAQEAEEDRKMSQRKTKGLEDIVGRGGGGGACRTKSSVCFFLLRLPEVPAACSNRHDRQDPFAPAGGAGRGLKPTAWTDSSQFEVLRISTPYSVIL